MPISAVIVHIYPYIIYVIWVAFEVLPQGWVGFWGGETPWPAESSSAGPGTATCLRGPQSGLCLSLLGPSPLFHATLYGREPQFTLISYTESSPQCPQSMVGTASLAAAPGGAAAAAAAPSAGSVPPPLGAPLPGGGPDGARPSNGRETEPAEANEPHTRHAGAVDTHP